MTTNSMNQADIAALVAALPQVRALDALWMKNAKWADLVALELHMIDPVTGYLAALEAVAALAERERRLREALVGLKRGHCWCEAGIGNPMMHGGHTVGCDTTRALLHEAKEAHDA